MAKGRRKALAEIYAGLEHARIRLPDKISARVNELFSHIYIKVIEYE